MGTKINFQIIDTCRNDKRWSVYTRIYDTYAGEKKYKIPNLYVNIGEWDKRKQRFKNSIVHNRILEKQISKFEDIILNYNLEDKPFSFENFEKDFFEDYSKNDVFSFIDYLLKTKYKSLEKSTSETIEINRKRLKGFRENILFSDISHSFYREYENYLWNNDYAHSVVNKSIKTLKMIENEAEKAGFVKQNVGRHYKLRSENIEVTFLNKDEILLLIEKYKKKEYKGGKQRALSAFLFSCFTGLRISEVESLKNKDFDGNILTIIDAKSKVKRTKQLNNFAIELLSPIPDQPNLSLLNIPSKQKTNQYIKDIALACKIDKHLSFKTGRSTYSTTLMKATGDIKLSSKETGHKKLTTTEKFYLGWDENDTIQANKKHMKYIFGE